MSERRGNSADPGAKRHRARSSPDLADGRAPRVVVKVSGSSIRPPAPGPRPAGLKPSTAPTRATPTKSAEAPGPGQGSSNPGSAAAASGKSSRVRTRGALRSLSSGVLPTSGSLRSPEQREGHSDRQMRVVHAKTAVPKSHLVVSSTKDDAKATTVRLPKQKPRAPRKSTTFVSPVPPSRATCINTLNPCCHRGGKIRKLRILLTV